jgi:hypothetical protein
MPMGRDIGLGNADGRRAGQVTERAVVTVIMNYLSLSGSCLSLSLSLCGVEQKDAPLQRWVQCVWAVEMSVLGAMCLHRLSPQTHTETTADTGTVLIWTPYRNNTSLRCYADDTRLTMHRQLIDITNNDTQTSFIFFNCIIMLTNPFNHV